MAPSNHIEEAVDAALSPVQTVIVTAVRTAYTTVATRHYNPDEGWDEQLFGFAVYKLIQYGLTRTAQDTNSGISIDPNSRSFRFTVGGFRFGLYRLGSRAVGTIDAAFPNNHNAAGQLALDNVQYKFELGADAYMPHSLVIGHLGNHEFGCEQIWIAEPLHEEEGAITEWGWTKQLWRFDGQMVQPAAVPTLPPAVPPKPVVLTLKRRSAKDNPPA